MIKKITERKKGKVVRDADKSTLYEFKFHLNSNKSDRNVIRLVYSSAQPEIFQIRAGFLE